MTDKFKYIVVTWDVYMETSLEELLNKYADDGWELVTMTGGDYKTITFRKKKEPE